MHAYNIICRMDCNGMCSRYFTASLGIAMTIYYLMATNVVIVLFLLDESY